MPPGTATITNTVSSPHYLFNLATVTPEASLFGGWVGYTIEISLQ